MYQSETVLLKLGTGDTMNVKSLEASDTGYTYQFHTVITLGSTDDMTEFTANGVMMELPGGIIFDKMSIRTLSVGAGFTAHATEPGVLLLGVKTKRTLFAN